MPSSSVGTPSRADRGRNTERSERLPVVTRGVLTADEAVRSMGIFTPGYEPPWSEDIVVLRQPRGVEAALVRALDIAVSSLVLVLTSPVALAVAATIRLDSRGPLILRQQRLGKDVRRFTLYTFRAHNLTWIGRWLKKTGIDQLPAFVNVLKGDMALVGPRPEMPGMFKHYERWQCAKWSVKPGMVGYAQVYGRGPISLQETIYWDVRFVLERSLATTVRVLAEAVRAACKHAGAF